MADSRRVGYAGVGLGEFHNGRFCPRSATARSPSLLRWSAGTGRRQGAWYAYDDYPKCLDNPEVEAVFIATTNGTHQDYAVRAAEAGHHVLREKPLANTVEQCLAINRACRRNKVRLMVAYRKYFEPASLALPDTPWREWCPITSPRPSRNSHRER